MINFTRAFDSAWERMIIILFRPFDLGKWFAIGFSAFLAGFLEGGNGININGNPFEKSNRYDWHRAQNQVTDAFSSYQIGLLIGIALVVLFFIFILVLLVNWLGARGQFMFLDNVTRNRGAISWPWSHYGRLANSTFFFYLIFLAVTLAVIVPIAVGAVFAALPAFKHHRWPQGGEIPILAIIVLLYLVVTFVLTFVLFIFREFGIPLMFRNGIDARTAFKESMDLIKNHTASVVVFVLLRIALWIALAILSIVACCCCGLGLIPYLGTVILLPALIYVKCFTLDCLAQFGPQYDAWTVDVAPMDPLATPPLPPG